LALRSQARIGKTNFKLRYYLRLNHPAAYTPAARAAPDSARTPHLACHKPAPPAVPIRDRVAPIVARLHGVCSVLPVDRHWRRLTRESPRQRAPKSRAFRSPFTKVYNSVCTQTARPALGTANFCQLCDCFFVTPRSSSSTAELDLRSPPWVPAFLSPRSFISASSCPARRSARTGLLAKIKGNLKVDQ
jgi:hypothetical protein